MTRGIYEPQLIPARTIMEQKERLLNTIRSTESLMCVRSGEQFFLGCPCKEYQVTSDISIASYFFDDHADHS